MKFKTKMFIKSMREEGLNASQIAELLEMTVNTIRTHIRRHPEIDGARKCLFCGKWVVQTPGKKIKKFCSDKCRRGYWNAKRGEKNEKD